MPLTVMYQYNAGGIQFSLYGYGDGQTVPVNFCFLWIGTQPQTVPDLPATWSQPGMYAFFAPAINTNWSSFARGLYALYQQYSVYHLRFAWIDPSAWELTTGIYVNNGLVTSSSNICFAQFRITMQKQPAISLNAGNDGFTIQNTGLSFLADRFDETGISITLSTPLEIKVAPAQQGTLGFSLDLSTAQLAACHAGIHYYHSVLQTGNPNQADYPYYFGFDYPVLNPVQTINLLVSLDVLSPLDPSRSFFSLSDTQDIPSLLPTKTGHFLSLQPTVTTIAGGNGFLLTPYPKQGQQTGLFCLGLQGSYLLVQANTISQNAAQNSTQLLCGLSGTEHIAIVTKSKDYAGDIIDFVPGQHALAPVFPIVNQATSNAGTNPSLLVDDPFCKTSWVQVRKNTPLPASDTINFYYCQPEDASLFKPQLSDVFLEIFDAEAGNTFDGTQPVPVAKCFPMVPYAMSGEAFSDPVFPGTVKDFEYQIINPFRKNTIVTKSDRMARDAVYSAYRKRLKAEGSLPLQGTLTTTPQGLLAEVDTSLSVQKWNALTLAINEGQSVSADTLLGLENVNATIQSAFQTNQQFLVVSKPGSFGTLSAGIASDTATVFKNSISIAGWPFHINIGANDYGDYSNIMLFKFCTGSLVDRIQNTQSWTQADDFAGDNNAQMMLSRWLLNYCNNVDQQYLTNPAFENIHSIIHDVNWNGILALNVDIGLSDFPEDIKGLLGGIDTTRFKADHFGVEINHITIVKGQLTTPASSSLFGLINYIDSGYINGQQPPGATNVDYDFKVLKLLVLFKNSAIVDFNSKLQLTINKLFDDAVVNNPSAQGLYNTILLDGSYENHNGQPTYIFNETGDQLFTINNNVLQVVEILKVQFNTLSTDQSSDDVQSRFSIWGNLAFANLATLDAFSFDKLAFNNLGIRMDFSDRNPSKRKFSFDPQVVGFDISNSTGRSQSFALNYPLAISGLLYSDGKQLPKDLGYLSVGSALDTQSKSIPKSWYALSFTLNLGTLGALASKVGLTANLVLVWGTQLANQGQSDYAAAVFIRLPGTGGSSSLFSLQNVLKLSIGAIRLYAQPDASTQTTAYLVKFSQIALKILSKQIPANGNTMMYLFGDPKQHSSPTLNPSQSSLGWYAAYQEKDSTKKS